MGSQERMQISPTSELGYPRCTTKLVHVLSVDPKIRGLQVMIGSVTHFRNTQVTYMTAVYCVMCCLNVSLSWYEISTYFQQCFQARCRTRDSKTVKAQCAQEQGVCNATIGSSMGCRIPNMALRMGRRFYIYDLEVIRHRLRSLAFVWQTKRRFYWPDPLKCAS